MSNLPLQPLVWTDTLTTTTIFRTYKVRLDVKGRFSVYYESSTGKPATGFISVDDAKHWAEFTHYASEMQPYVKPDSITDIANWFKAAKPEPTDKDLSTQIGCLFEEVVELLEGLGLQNTRAREQLHYIAGLFKANTFGDYIEALSYEKRIEIVDACCDINVTSVGVMQLLGSVDVLGAQREVIRSNNSKMVKGKFIFDDNGKIMKPDSYSKPDLTPFVSTMQNLHTGE